MTIQLRPYALADFEKLHEIDQACYEPRIAYSRTEMRRYLRFPGADCVVAEATPQEKRAEVAESGGDAPTLIGFCITAHRGPWGYIITMDVLAAYRRSGVGSMLLAESEKRMAARGVRQIGLETATNNFAAIAFWQKHGYGKSGVRKNYYPGGRDAYSMAKRLASHEMTAKAGPHR
ncbi:MAG: GNAT family N-acetyltransferase [Candidatus Acidiferrales bacterium]